MSDITASEFAGLLYVSPRRARQIAESGDVIARKTSMGWLIDEGSALRYARWHDLQCAKQRNQFTGPGL